MFTFNKAIKKLKKYNGEKTDAEIARALKITPQALSGFKKNDKYPPELLIRYCVKNGLSTDWMFGIERPDKQTEEIPIPTVTCPRQASCPVSYPHLTLPTIYSG